MTRAGAQVMLLPHSPEAVASAGGDNHEQAATSLVLLERWTFAHERAAAAEASSPGTSPHAALARRPSLFESARSLEAPVIYKRTVRFAVACASAGHTLKRLATRRSSCCGPCTPC